MGRNITLKLSIEELKNINISTFTKSSQLKFNTITNGCLEWSINGIVSSSISYKLEMFENDGILHISYVYKKDKTINYSIDIISKKSNLGNGYIYYFVCPMTNIICRKLHLYNGYFYHRSYYNDLIYNSQRLSKKSRELNKIYSMYYDNDLFDEVIKKHFKKSYKGKLTKKYLKFLENEKRIDSLNLNSSKLLENLLLK